MPSKTFRTHCKVCGDPITDSTQRVTCLKHRKRLHSQVLETCPCGKPAKNFKSKYCSTEHQKKWGIKPPVAIITHVCQNPACGKDFERPWFYPGKTMFCSIKCSNAQHSSKRQRHYQFGDLNLNSAFELRFVACLERLKIEWSPWPDDELIVYTTPDGIEHEYRPDFRVGDLIIEIKGWAENPDSNQRFAWEDADVVLIDRDKLNSLERIFNRRKFLEALL